MPNSRWKNWNSNFAIQSENDETGMKKLEGMTNDCGLIFFRFRFVLLSSFDIRASSFQNDFLTFARAVHLEVFSAFTN